MTLITERQAFGYAIRQDPTVRHEADRLAASYWHGLRSVDEARVEFRGILIGLFQRASVDTDRRVVRIKSDYPRDVIIEVADSVLADDIARHEREHEATVVAVMQALARPLKDGATIAQAKRIAADVARTRPIPPPFRILDHAIAEAAAERRRVEQFWARREAVA